MKGIRHRRLDMAVVFVLEKFFETCVGEALHSVRDFIPLLSDSIREKALTRAFGRDFRNKKMILSKRSGPGMEG